MHVGVPLVKLTDEKEIPFAHRIMLNREMWGKICSWVSSSLGVELRKGYPYKLFVSGRDMLQWVGEQVRLSEDMAWTDYLFTANPQRPLVIDDMRFISERATVRKHGGVLVLIRRGENKDTHASETQIGSPDEYDYVIDNTGSVADLHRQIEELWIGLTRHE